MASVRFAILAAILGVFFVKGTVAFQCYECQWKEANTVKKFLTSIGITAGKNDLRCRDEFDYNTKNGFFAECASGCIKQKMVYDGDQKVVARGCALANTKHGCDVITANDYVTETCVCHDEKCNGATHTTAPVSLALLLPAASYILTLLR